MAESTEPDHDLCSRECESVHARNAVLPWRPKVSVVTPVRNREGEVCRAIRSVLSQTYEELEMLVVDDHSTDGTPRVVDELAAGDSRVRLLHVLKGAGAQAARNTGIRAATGEFIAFLDSDDEWLPSLLTACLSRLGQTTACVAYTEGRIIHGPAGWEEPRTGVARLETQAYRTLLLRPPGPIFSCLVVERAAIQSIGPLDEDLVAFQEWDTCLRLAERFGSFALVDEPLFLWHRHGGETISGDGRRNAAGYEQVVAKHRAAILARVGPEGLSAHYAQLARLHHRLGHMGREWRFWAKAVAMGAKGPDPWTMTRRHVIASVTGRSYSTGADTIRVYG